RSIIFATDNDIQGEPIYTLGEAADLVEERDIALFGIHAGESTQEQQDEYREIVLEHGGLFYEASNPDLVDGVLDRINDSQSTTIEASPTVLISDSARGPYGAMMGLAGFYLRLVWALRACVCNRSGHCGSPRSSPWRSARCAYGNCSARARTGPAGRAGSGSLP